MAKEKEEGVELEGKVVECVKGGFVVEIPNPDPDGKPFRVSSRPAGKLRLHNIKIVQGDSVKIEVSPYDITKGRITYRLKT